MESTIGLIIQFTGVFLLTVLSLFLRRSLKTAAAKYWAIGWASLAFALFCASCALVYKEIAKPLFCLYLLGEYAFGLMLIFGCRSLAEDYKSTFQSKLIFLPFIPVAICLSFLTIDFNLIFHLQSFLMATFFAVGFFTLRRRRLNGFGARLMSVALALLAVASLNYFVIFLLRQFNFNPLIPENYFAFSPVFDLILEVMLGFGMVIVLLEQVLGEMRKVNEKLREAHEKLKQTAHTDSLTTALNRHAFYGFVSKSGAEQATVSGCVGFFDIDDLKPINDHYGHAVGDLAIRAVVSAIRKLIRAEDLIYRWGGDEFFVLLVSMDEEMARGRMKNLDKLLTDIRFEGVEMPLTVRVSYGFRDFSDVSDLDQAIKAADEEMYCFKYERKQIRKSLSAADFILTENKTAFHQTAKIT